MLRGTIILSAAAFVLTSSEYSMVTQVRVVCRYIIGANRALFVLTDGGRAFEVKNFLVEQDRCALVTIEQRDYPGKGASQEVH